MRRAQPALRCRQEIVGVGRDHHAFTRRQVERFTGSEIDARLGLVVARDLGAEDRIPREAVAAGDVDHQRDIAVRDRREQATTLEPREAGCRIRPAVEPVPRQIEIARHLLGEAVDAETRQDALEIVPVQHVELAERDAAAAHLLHRRLVLVPPGIGEGKPVELVAGRRKNALGLARDAAAPIDHGAEDIEEQRLDLDLHDAGPRPPSGAGGLHALGLEHAGGRRPRQHLQERLRRLTFLLVVLDVRAERGRVDRVVLDLGGQRPHQRDAFHRQNLADLVDAKLGFAVGDVLGHRAARNQLGFGLHLGGDPELVEQARDIDAA